MEKTTKRAVAVVAMVLAFALPAAGCSESSASPETASASAAVAAGATVIDVRTPAEFAAGHLTGAVNIPVELPDFGARIAQLDPKASYIVYCRTGRRSAIAVDQMKDVGFTDLLDLGAIEKAADATGLAIVQG